MINIIIELEFLLQSAGTIGIVIFYIVIAKLSAMMGKGLRLPSHNRWYYAACIMTLLTIPIHLYLHQIYENPHSMESVLDLEGLYISFLIMSNVIVIIASSKYWWWLKDELLEQWRLKKRSGL